MITYTKCTVRKGASIVTHECRASEVVGLGYLEKPSDVKFSGLSFPVSKHVRSNCCDHLQYLTNQTQVINTGLASFDTYI